MREKRMRETAFSQGGGGQFTAINIPKQRPFALLVKQIDEKVRS